MQKRGLVVLVLISCRTVVKLAQATELISEYCKFPHNEGVDEKSTKIKK